MRQHRTTTAIAAAMLLVGCALGAAQAQVLDTFNYAVGSSIDRQAGGTGWSTGWFDGFQQGTFTETVTAGSLTYGSLTTSGNAYTVTSQVVGGGTFVEQSRDASTPFTDGTAAYFSFLVNSNGTGTPQGSYFGAVFGSAFVGGGGGFYGLGQAGQPTTASTVADTVGTTHLLVLRADLQAGNDVLRLYIDPVSSTEPVAADVTRTDFDLGTASRYTFTWGQGGGATFDELRSGTTFASVTPGLAAVAVPEAGSATLLLGSALVGGIVTVLRRRK